MENPIRNFVAKGLGALWILDGLLQFQPQMFGPNFVSHVLTPNLAGQPAFMHAVVAFGITLWNINPPIMDVLAGLLQIGIGVLLLFPLSSKSFRVGAYVSVVWGVVVWLCGEGASLLLTGNASFYTGAPGAVLFYSIPAAFLLMGEKMKTEWFPKLVGWTFLLGALLQLQSAFWSTDGVQDVFMALPTSLMNALSAHPLAGNALLILLPLVTGLFILFKPDRITAVVALVFLFLVWWWAQDFGMLLTVWNGTATDPNTAPLLALLLAPLFFSSNPIADRA